MRYVLFFYKDSESRNVKIAHQEVSKSPTPVGDTATTASQVNKRDTPSINVSTSRMPDSFFDAEQTRLPANSTAISSKVKQSKLVTGTRTMEQGLQSELRVVLESHIFPLTYD